MRILVTGGAGFIGTAVVQQLLEAGHEVRVLDALTPSAHPAGVSYQPPQGVEFVRGDVRDEDVVDRVLRGIDVVNHQAALVGRGREIMDAPRFVGTNDFGTAVLLAAMTRAGVRRMILASSVVVYGDSRYTCPQHGYVRPRHRSREDLEAGRFEPRCPACGEDVTASAAEEDDVPDPPRNVYAISKLAQEHLAGAWAKETTSSVNALRYHSVYGPRMPYDSPYSGVASAFRSSVARGEAPRVYEDGLPRRDFIHVNDVARANVLALGREDSGLRAFNVATGTPRTIGEMASVLASAAGAPPPVITGRYRIGDVRHIFASSTRIRHELGWQPLVGFEAGMREFAAAPMRKVAESAL